MTSPTMRSVGVKLRLDYGDYTRDTEGAAASTARLRGGLTDLGAKGQANLQNLSSKMAILGVGFAAVAGYAVKANMDFEKVLSEVGAVANATGEQLDQLRTAAIQAGQATVFSASEAAQAEAELAKAGVSTSDILNGALTGSLSLASAGQVDLAESATIAAAAMNTFGLKGTDVAHIADVLAAGANKSAAGVEDLGQGMQQVGLVAHQAGLSLEDTVGVLSAFADRGLRGQDGATSLKTALQRLIAPTDTAKSTLEGLGISAYDADGNLVSIVDIAGQLQSRLEALSPAQRNAALQTIFGTDAIRAANVLYSLGADGIKDYIDAVNDQGAATDVAAKKMDNLAGDVEQLKGSIETVAIQSGGGVSTGLRTLAQGATGAVNAIGGLPPVVQTSITVLTGLAGVTLLGGAAAIKLKANWGQVRDSLDAVGPSALRLGTRLQGLAKIAAISSAGLAVLSIAGSQIQSAMTDPLPAVDSLTAGLQDFARTGKLGGDVTKVLGANTDDLGRILNGVSNSGFARASDAVSDWVINLVGMDSPTDDATRKIQLLDQALAQMVQSGHGADAALVVARLKEQVEAQGGSVDRLISNLPSYEGAVAAAGQATDDTAGSTHKAAQTTNELAAAFGVATDAAKDLTYAQLALNGTQLSWREAQRKAEAAVDDLQAAVKASSGSLDIHTAKGRAAAGAVDDLAQAAADAAQAKYAETGSVDAANKVYKAYIDQLRRILLQAGLSKTTVDNLISSIATMPSTVTTTIDVKVKVSNPQDWSDLRRMEREGDKTLNRTVAVTPTTSHQQRRWGGITHAATGVLSDAAVYSARSPAMYAFAEPQTGGEAFVPRNGNASRSLGILSAAAGWYGADVVPRNGWYGSTGGSGGSAGGDMPGVDVRVFIGDQELKGMVRSEVSESNRTTRRLVRSGAQR